MDQNNIVPFPRSPHIELLAAEREKTRNEDRRRRIELVRSVRGAKSFASPDDVIWPAQAIDRLLEEARKAGKRAEDVRKALAGRGIEVRHWERLRIDGGLSPGEAKRDRERRDLDAKSPIVKKVPKYVGLLEALADVLGRHPDDVLFEAFENTQFAKEPDRQPGDPIDDAVWLVGEMSRAVVTAADLGRYFREVRGLDATYDPASKEFFRYNDPLMWFGHSGAPGKEGGYQGEADVFIKQPPFPGVPLFRFRQNSFKGSLRVEKSPVAKSDISPADLSRIVTPLPMDEPGFVNCSPPKQRAKLRGFKVMPAEVSVYSDVRLVIGPRKNAEDFGPMLEVRSFVELKIGQDICPLSFPFSLFGISAHEEKEAYVNDYIGSVAAKFQDGWHRVTGFGLGDWGDLHDLGPHFGYSLDATLTFDEFEGGNRYDFLVGWHPLNRGVLGHLFRAHSNGQRLFDTKGPYPEPTMIWLSSCPDLQVALHTGALEAALLTDCAHLRGRLDAFMAATLETRHRETADLLDRWHRLAAPDSDA